MADQTVVEAEGDDEINVVDSKTLDAFINRGIREYLGKVPVATMVGWYGKAGTIEYFQTPKIQADGSASVHPLPIDRYSVPMAIFQNDEVIRVYTLPMPIPKERPADWVDRGPRRFTFTKTAPTLVIEEMTLATIGAEIVDEWTQLAEEMTSADAELEKVVSLVEAMETDQPNGTNLKEWIRKQELLDLLEDKVHRETEEDDDEEEEDEVANGGVALAATSAPSAAIPTPPTTTAPSAPSS
jgi:hypothetical protein